MRRRIRSFCEVSCARPDTQNPAGASVCTGIRYCEHASRQRVRNVQESRLSTAQHTSPTRWSRAGGSAGEENIAISPARRELDSD